jgi:hypothetical protein
VLKLAISSGAQHGTNHTYTINIVPPSGAYEVKCSNLFHTHNFISVEFLGHIYLTPTDVSFARLSFREGTANAIATGYFASDNGRAHPVGIVVPISGCNTSTGCLAGGDQVGVDDSNTPFSTGDFVWHLPWAYQILSGTFTTFTTVTHHDTAAASGLATIEKRALARFLSWPAIPRQPFKVRIDSSWSFT